MVLELLLAAAGLGKATIELIQSSANKSAAEDRDPTPEELAAVKQSAINDNDEWAKLAPKA